MEVKFLIDTLSYISVVFAFGGFLSGLYALWYDERNRNRMKRSAITYAALVLSTTSCLWYMLLMADWKASPEAFASLGVDKNITRLLYHCLDKMVVFLFHVVLIIKVLRTRATDERVSSRSNRRVRETVQG